MHKPEMILFDYAHTLVYEPAFDRVAGCRAVLRCCVSNPRGIGAEELAAQSLVHFRRYQTLSREQDMDVMDVCAARLTYESLGLRFSCSLTELERRFWDAAGPGHPMPGAEEMLLELGRRGIRTGVVSNMNFREENLISRIDRLLPGHSFEFILSSCEYATRKPRAEFFQLALAKAGLPPQQVWFAGDNPRCDVLGAANAGLRPLWYEPEADCPYRSPEDRVALPADCLHLRSWAELAPLLDGLE